MSSIKAIMVMRQSSVEEMMEELVDVIASQDGLVIKIERDYIFDSMFDLNTEKVDINIEDDTFMYLAKTAHEKNITLNQLITDILVKQLDKEKVAFNGITPKAEVSFEPNNI